MNKHQWPLWLLALYAHLGEREMAPGDNGAIMNFFRIVRAFDVANDELPSCAAGVGASLERVGIGSTRSLMAKSYLEWGQALDGPRVGAVAVFDRAPDPDAGHVAFVVDWGDHTVDCLGSNQGDAVSIARFARDTVRAWRWPRTDARASPAFESALKHVLGVEGGYVNDPQDPGGPTNLGVTLDTLTRWRGRPTTAADVQRITVEEALAIYTSWYWFKSWADQLPPALAVMHFDCAVNQGAGDAARFLQEAVAADVDGEIGPKTIAMAHAADVRESVLEYAAVRESDYRSLGGFPRYGRGWLDRLARTRDLALSMITNEPQPKEQPMDGQTQAPTPTAPPKALLNSMTLWGALITFVSAVLPPVANAYGIPLTPELVTGLSGQAATAVQALFGLVGTGMTVYGRMRATQPLSVR